MPKFDMDSEADRDSRDEDPDRKDKKGKKQKTDIKKAFRMLKTKMTPRRSTKNEVKEICIKPESDETGPNECWASESVAFKKRGGLHSESSSRSHSAGSKGSDIVDIEDDGIPVIYDAAYNGGGE